MLDWMSSFLGSVDNMLSGKKVFSKLPCLEKVSLGTAMWVSGTTQPNFKYMCGLIYLIYNVIIVVMHIPHAGHESDWTLHRRASNAKLPYFRADCCHSYISYAFFYVHPVKSIVPQLAH